MYRVRHDELSRSLYEKPLRLVFEIIPESQLQLKYFQFFRMAQFLLYFWDLQEITI